MWELRIDPIPTRWAVVPEQADDELRAAWVAEVSQRVFDHWGTTGDGGLSEAFTRALRPVVDVRLPGTLREVITWPLPSLWPARVVFLLLPSSDGDDWSERGFRSTAYVGAPFGPGVQHTRTVRSGSETASDDGPIETVIVFDRGDMRLLVHVPPLPTQMHLLMAGPIADIIGRASLIDPEGALFRAAPDPRALPMTDADLWPSDLVEGEGQRA